MPLQMVVRSPFLLGLSLQTLTTRVHALESALPTANVQRMVEYYPSLLEVNAMYLHLMYLEVDTWLLTS